MVKKSSICSSVEGEKLSFNTRQYYAQPPVIHAVLKKKVYPFKLGINGYVEIDTPLDSADKTACFSTSLVNVGDAVQGGAIDGWSTKMPKSPEKQTNATGTHSASFGVLKGHGFAHVQSSHRDHLQSADIQARHPEVVIVINPVYATQSEQEQPARAIE